MTLDVTVLQKLAEWHPPREGRQSLAVSDEASGWVMNLTVDKQDDFSCAVWEIVLRRMSLLPTEAGSTLESWAKRVAGRVTGLLEPLRIMEIDVERDEAQLRSDEPAHRTDELFYYEVLLRGTRQAAVRRYHAPMHEGRREQIPFSLTHEALAKFVADLAAD